ncbi:hypothetical protein [Chengkuizengella sediminis]|uniref:hypothetical protein n=1 Tax=Chengkuizengella sediminis TaxID=1885917 RepID=UPI0013896977|nr:hypothetical protein [Chengkuizengella sediminis]NDI34010.1 hypothetical protein [Chengkuizengella sediminis]
MKNVVIHKVVKLVFTEDHLKGYWNKQNSDLAFDSLTNEQLVSLAKKMMKNTSHSMLEQHIVGSDWRTEEETKGKLLEEDDSVNDEHIEVIETSVPGSKSKKLLIDRLLKVDCKQCEFSFFVSDLNADTSKLTCPSCGGEVIADN